MKIDDVSLGGIYCITPPNIYQTKEVMISVENQGWKFYNWFTLTAVVLERNVFCEPQTEKDELVNVRILLPDGVIGTLWNPERLKPLEIQ